MNYLHIDEWLHTGEWFFIAYALSLSFFYILLIVNSAFTVVRQRRGRRTQDYVTGAEQPITLISPAYNEEKSIVAAVESLLMLDYPEYEVIIVNDGSTDNTLEIMVAHFQLYLSDDQPAASLETRAVKATYRSRMHPRLKLIDKMNGGKADALNTGINYSAYPLICGVDADSILTRNSLIRIVQPLLKDPSTVAIGGMIKVMNGCEIYQGRLLQTGLPSNPLALLQVVEYTRAFLYGRLGWLPFHAILLISGAFGLFQKDTLIEVGGFSRDTIGEDMELIVRLHRVLSKKGKPYRIDFAADAICWTECPEDMQSLQNQRIRWQRGLGESLIKNLPLLFSRQGGPAGWMAFPFLLIYELFGPAIELAGVLLILVAFNMGAMTTGNVLAFTLLVLGLSLAISSLALLIDEFHESNQRSLGELFILFLVIIAEALFYRQLVNYWRTIGLYRWMTGSKSSWGKIIRRGSQTVCKPT